MGKSIVFIHGALMTPLCWEQFNGYFAGKGYACTAPAWPYHERPVAEQQRNPAPQLADLGVKEIVDHYAGIIAGMSEPPILIGHSFGGLFVQMLMDRGLGAAGVAIDPAPPRGVWALRWSAIKSNAGVLMRWRGWRRSFYPSFKTFQYAFMNTVPAAEARAVYDQQVVPETGRIFFQTAVAPLNPSSAVKVNFKNPTRAPLLLIAGSSDHTVPAATNRANYRAYPGSPARTDFKEFAGRCHWIVAQTGWEEVAGYVADWLERVGQVA